MVAAWSWLELCNGHLEHLVFSAYALKKPGLQAEGEELGGTGGRGVTEEKQGYPTQPFTLPFYNTDIYFTASVLSVCDSHPSH